LATASLALIAFAAIAFRPASAFEKAITAIRDTPSYIVEVAVAKPSKKEQLKLYRLAGSFRMEAYEAGEIVQYTVTSRNKPGITVYSKENAFIYRPPDRGDLPPLAMLKELANFKGRGVELVSKLIDDHPAVGFLVNLNEIDPDVPTGTLQMWVDLETNRPLELTMDFGSKGSMRFFDFDWNADPAPELFNTEPPDGYVDRTPEPTGNQELVAHATRALGTYRELIGTYPKVKTPYADRMRDEMYEKIGDKRNDPRSDEYVQVIHAMNGFTHMMAVFRHKEEAVYYGRNVTAADGNKILFRWKTKDGRYQVIYGDLRAELVSEAQLRVIEGR
jgi:outer membrane lipoprotein-sorting protein